LRCCKLTTPSALRTSLRLEMGTARPTERAFFFLGCARTDKTKGSAAIRSTTGTRIATERPVPCRGTGVTSCVGYQYPRPRHSTYTMIAKRAHRRYGNRLSCSDEARSNNPCNNLLPVLGRWVKAWLKVTGRPEANYDIMKSSAGQNGTCQHYPGLNFANLTREYSLVALPCMADVFKNDMSCKSKQVELQGSESKPLAEPHR